MIRFPAVAFLVSLAFCLPLPPSAAMAACLGAVSGGPRPPGLQQAAFRPAAIQPAAARPVAAPAGNVRITFIGHATFLLETPRGVTAATDYNDYLRPPLTPDVATMNHAHGTHYTDAPDPGIRHVLRGWTFQGNPARHNLQVGDLRVRNVPTNIRGYGSETEYDGNSIFVFDAADLCIAHLGHLHHKLTPGHLADLGRIDVLFVPVDGGFTLNIVEMREVIGQISAPLVIPMHYFSESTLERFLSRLRDSHDIRLNDTSSILVSRGTLPKKPAVIVLPGPH